MGNYFYSAKKNAFYPVSLEKAYRAANSWPEDGVEVDDSIYLEYSATPPEGKVRVAKNGMPSWADIPPPSREEQIAVAEHQKAALLAEASVIIAPMADAQAGGYIDDADVPRLAEWQRYRYKLTKVDTSTAPDITLPPKPEV